MSQIYASEYMAKILSTEYPVYEGELDKQVFRFDLPSLYNYGGTTVIDATVENGEIVKEKIEKQIDETLDKKEKIDISKISKEELLSGFSGQPTKFNLATYIFIYEKMNNILESQRTWTVDDVTDSTTWKQLLHLMVYQ